jgi:Succinylglutamate desuccinylase / Aspartoacylase family
VAWGVPERARWLAGQRKLRSYDDDVVSRIERLAARFAVEEYGQLHYPPDRYRQLAVRTPKPRDDRPWVLVTGGVHGYETSGVHGALQFLEQRSADYEHAINLLAVPAVSPWAYERIHRWNADAIDPNRSFRADSPAAEAAALLQLVAPLKGRFLLHVDLHETTDSDESEFGPALAARDGKPFARGVIPDGFYLVDDSKNPQPDFQRAIIEAVARVTHIAPADDRNEIIGSPLIAPGVIEYPMRELGLCAGITGARYTTTTEVYPDSPRATPDQCNEAQVTAVRAAIEFALRA